MSILTVPARYGVRGGLAADLASVNEIPLVQEIIFETDTLLFKLGNGVDHYNDLAYISTGGGAGGAFAYTQDSSDFTATNSIPYDNTIPQNNEGDEYSALSTTITPTDAGSVLEIEVTLQAVTCTAVNTMIAALFRDSTANAIDSTIMAATSASYPHPIPLRVFVAAGSTSPTTFKLRLGMNVASGIFRVNGEGTNRLGGTIYSSLTIREHLP